MYLNVKYPVTWKDFTIWFVRFQIDLSFNAFSFFFSVLQRTVWDRQISLPSQEWWICLGPHTSYTHLWQQGSETSKRGVLKLCYQVTEYIKYIYIISTKKLYSSLQIYGFYYESVNSGTNDIGLRNTFNVMLYFWIV